MSRDIDNINITQAISLTGTEDERTAIITVTAEDGVTKTIYKVIFSIETHTHNLATEYSSDETGHWYECSDCDDKVNLESHTEDSGTVTIAPTETTEGVKTYKCAKCGYVMRTETIPATGYIDYPSYPTSPTYPTYSPVTTAPSVFSEKVTVKAGVDGSTVTLRWNKIKKADSYIIYQYKEGKYVKVKTTTDTSVTFKKLKNGETYKFLVRYTINGRLSPTSYSGKVTAKIYYKPIVKAAVAKNSVRLSWKAVPGAEKYAVYKYVDGKAVKLTETEKRAITIRKLKSNTEYKYIVRAYVDGKWTTMLKSDIVTVKTKAE